MPYGSSYTTGASTKAFDNQDITAGSGQAFADGFGAIRDQYNEQEEQKVQDLKDQLDFKVKKMQYDTAELDYMDKELDFTNTISTYNQMLAKYEEKTGTKLGNQIEIDRKNGYNDEVDAYVKSLSGNKIGDAEDIKKRLDTMSTSDAAYGDRRIASLNKMQQGGVPSAEQDPEGYARLLALTQNDKPTSITWDGDIPYYELPYIDPETQEPKTVRVRADKEDYVGNYIKQVSGPSLVSDFSKDTNNKDIVALMNGNNELNESQFTRVLNWADEVTSNPNTLKDLKNWALGKGFKVEFDGQEGFSQEDGAGILLASISGNSDNDAFTGQIKSFNEGRDPFVDYDVEAKKATIGLNKAKTAEVYGKINNAELVAKAKASVISGDNSQTEYLYNNAVETGNWGAIENVNGVGEIVRGTDPRLQGAVKKGTVLETDVFVLPRKKSGNNWQPLDFSFENLQSVDDPQSIRNLLNLGVPSFTAANYVSEDGSIDTTKLPTDGKRGAVLSRLMKAGYKLPVAAPASVEQSPVGTESVSVEEPVTDDIKVKVLKEDDPNYSKYKKVVDYQARIDKEQTKVDKGGNDSQLKELKKQLKFAKEKLYDSTYGEIEDSIKVKERSISKKEQQVSRLISANPDNPLIEEVRSEIKDLRSDIQGLNAKLND